jgi:hypothetical protein
MVLAEKECLQAHAKHMIVPTGNRLSYVEAFNLVREIGGLPSNVLHDDTLVRFGNWKQLGLYYPAWAREVIVHPERNGMFRAGKDVVDADPDCEGRSWIFPSSLMPVEALGRHGMALFIDPQEIRVEGRKVVIETDPKSIMIVKQFPQVRGWGRVDERTRLPLALAPESRMFDAERYLVRVDGAGVRPVVRGCYSLRRVVDASYWHDLAFGVGSVSCIETASEIEVAKQAVRPGGL